MPPPRRKRVVKKTAKRNPRVFLVHGHNHGTLQMVARVLEKMGCKPIILHEQPNKGRTIFQKFTNYSDVEFAVILLTGDDSGGVVGSRGKQKRARQNVILELGFFLGALGADKVCSLYEEGVELPSDYDGVIYISLSPAEKWKTLLARELVSAGIIKISAKKLLAI